MSISRNDILTDGQRFSPNNFIEEQLKREPHHVISLITTINWKGCTFKKLSQYVFPQCAIVTIENIEYPTKNTRQTMQLGSKESEVMLDYKTAYDQVDEIIKPLEISAVFHLSALRGANKKVAKLIESCLLPEPEYEVTLINDEEVIRLIGDITAFNYPSLKEYLTVQAPKNIFKNIENEKIAEMAENTRKQLLQSLDKAASFARKHVADADKEINNARIGKGGKSSYDPFFDEAMMRFLAIDAKFEVSADSGLRMQPKADVIVNAPSPYPTNQENQASNSDVALLRSEITELREQLSKPKEVKDKRPMKRCYQCANDVFLEARKCMHCGDNPNDPNKDPKAKEAKEIKNG